MVLQYLSFEKKCFSTLNTK